MKLCFSSIYLLHRLILVTLDRLFVFRRLHRHVDTLCTSLCHLCTLDFTVLLNYQNMNIPEKIGNLVEAVIGVGRPADFELNVKVGSISNRFFVYVWSWSLDCTSLVLEIVQLCRSHIRNTRRYPFWERGRLVIITESLCNFRNSWIPLFSVRVGIQSEKH